MMHNHCILAFWVIITQFILKTKHCIYFTVYRKDVFWCRILLPLGKHILLTLLLYRKTHKRIALLTISTTLLILLLLQFFYGSEHFTKWNHSDKKEKEHCSPVKNTGKQCSLFSFRRYEAYDFKGVCFNICYKAT